MQATDIQPNSRWFYKQALNASGLVSVYKVDAKGVEFFRGRGGFSRIMSIETFLQEFRPITQEETADILRRYSPVQVTGEWMEDDINLAAHSNGETWNGWSCPGFEKEVLLDGLEKGYFSKPGPDQYSYLFEHPGKDAFVLVSAIGNGTIPVDVTPSYVMELLQQAGESEDFPFDAGGVELYVNVYPAVEIDTDGGPKKIYHVGEFFWCWDTIDPVPSEEPDAGPRT